MKNVAEQSLELQNGIIWSINATAHNCGVKLLGSTDIINVDFPPSWMVVPNWVQLGCPVQMAHRYGFRNTLEIIGPGHIIPAQTTGDNQPVLDPSVLPDRVLSGCVVNELELIPQMAVMVQTGSVRIGGSTVVIDSIKMDTTVYKMDMGGKMNNVAAISTIAARPALPSYLRYDILSVGTDAVIDITKGASFKSSASTATISTLSQAHIELGRILLSAPATTTTIHDSDINRVYTSAIPQRLDVSANDTDLSATQTTAAITVEVRDQYQNALIKQVGKGWQMELEITAGSGSVASTAGSSTASIKAYTGSSAAYTFTYTRTTADASPMFAAKLIAPTLENAYGITIRTSDGEIATT